MKKAQSSFSHLGILLIARMAFDLEFQIITLFFSTFHETFQIEIWLLSFLLSLFAISTLLSPIFGALSDRYGRKHFLTGGLVVFAIGSGLMAGAQSWVHLFVARALMGLGYAIFFPALHAELGDKYAYEKRTRAMGIVRLAWPITFMLGVPLVGYSIEHLSWRLPYAALALLALSAGVIINLRVPTEVRLQSPGSSRGTQFALFKKVLMDRSALAGLAMMLFAVGAIEGLFTFFPVWMEIQFQRGETDIALIFSIMGAGTLLGTLLAAGIGDKFGPKRCAVTGLIAAAIFKALIPQLKSSLIAVIFCVLLLGIVFDFSMTILPALLTQLAPDAKGTIMSLNQALNAAAMTVTYALSGLLWANSSFAVIGLVFGSMTLTGALIGFFNIHIPPNEAQEAS